MQTSFHRIGPAILLGILILSALDNLCAADPDQQAEAIVSQAQKLEAAGREDSAKSLLSTTAHQYQAAVQKEPSNASLWSALARIQLRQRQFEEAEKSIDEALRLQPNSGTFHSIRGCILVCSDRVPAAEMELRRACELEPKNIQIRIDTTAAYARVQRFVDAEAQAHAALEIDARHPGAIVLYGLLQLQNGKHREALETLRAGAKLQPQDLLVRKALVSALCSLELFNEAYIHRRELYEIDRDNGDALVQLILLGSQLKKSDEVEAYIAQLYALHRQGKHKVALFARERFSIADKTIEVREFFATSEESPFKYMFYVNDASGQQESIVTLTTSRRLNRLFRQPDADDAKPMSAIIRTIDGKQEHFGGFAAEPDYDQTRKLVVEILEGKRKAFPQPPATKEEATTPGNPSK